MGINRKEYLYDIQFWELLLISRGYDRRHFDIWSAVRWQTYNIMSAIPYVDMAKAGIHKITDLLQLPWDKKDADAISEDEEQEILREMEMLKQAWSKEGEE